MYNVMMTKEMFEIREGINGEMLARLNMQSGNALVIAFTYQHLTSVDRQKGQDFINGVLLGLTHAQLIQMTVVAE